MTIQELCQQLTRLVRCNLGDITSESEVIVTVGVLKGTVQQKLREDGECFPGPAITFIEDAIGIDMDPDDDDDVGPRPVIIRSGNELEIRRLSK
jgi:hypothetical protein